MSLTTLSGSGTSASISTSDDTASYVSFPGFAYEAVDGIRQIPVTTALFDASGLDDAGADTKIVAELVIGSYTTLYYDPIVSTEDGSTSPASSNKTAVTGGIVVGVIAAIVAIAAVALFFVVRSKRNKQKIETVVIGGDMAPQHGSVP